MTSYVYEGKYFEIDTQDPAVAKAKIEAHLGVKKGVAELPDDPNVTPITERGRAAAGGLEAAGSIITQIPGMVIGGLSGLGTAIGTGGDMEAAASVASDVQNKIPHYKPQTEYGQLAMQGLDDLRTLGGDMGVKAMQNPINKMNPLMAPLTMANALGGEPLVRSTAEAGADLTIGIPALPRGARGGRAGRLTPAEIQFLQDRKNPPSPPADPVQLEMPLESGFRPGTGPLPYQPTQMPLRDMRSSTVQGDLFDDSHASFPGEARTQQMRRGEPVPYEGPSLEEPNLSVREPMEPFRQGDFDFPLRQEAIDKDPYLQTLREEATRAYNENLRVKKWMKAHGQTKNMTAKAEDSAKRVQEVTDLAEAYLRSAYRVDKPDQYTGSMWLDKDKRGNMQMPIERSGTRDATKSDMKAVPGMDLPDTRGNRVTQKYTIEKTPTWSGTARGRQRGALNIEEIQKAIAAIAKRAEALEGKLESLTPIAREKAEKQLEKLYYDQMKGYNAIEALSDPKHPLHEIYKKDDDIFGKNIPPRPGKKNEAIVRKGWTKNPHTGKWTKVNPFSGPGKKQAGAIDFEGFKKEMLNPKMVDLQGVSKRIDELNAMLGDANYLTKAETKPIRDEMARLLRVERDLTKDEFFANRRVRYNPDGSFGPPKGGPGDRQRGAIFTRDPEFVKFKDSLPEPMKGRAKALYKEWKKMSEPQKAPPVLENEGALTTLDGLPGVKHWVDEVAPITKSPEELKPIMLTEPDLPKDFFSRAGRQLVAGAKLLGFGTQDTLVRLTAQQVDKVHRQATRHIEDLILHENKGFKPKWDALKPEERALIWAELINQEGKGDLTRNQMFDMGYTEKMADAAEALRRGLEGVYHRLNEARAEIGKGPVEWRPGYIPSRFRGDWTVHARDAEGQLVHIVGANTQWGAKNLKALMQEKFPDLKFGDVKHEPIHRFKDSSDANAGYQAMLEVLADEDPRVKAIEDVYQDYLKKQAYNTLSLKKHFWDKEGVQGFEGGKAWKDGIENAEEGLRSVMNYMDHALKWAEAQVELKPLRTLLKDPEIQAQKPTTVAWAQFYMDQALGRTPKLARALDSVIDVLAANTGIGQSLMLKGIRDTKYFMTALYLGFMNAGFSLSQMLQVMQTVPAWMLMLKGKGAGASILDAYARGAMDSTKGFFLGKRGMTALGEQAWKYAKEYGIVEPKILDDVRSWQDKPMSAKLDALATWNMTRFEKLARTQAYMSWVHFLHATGEFKMGKELYQAAAHLTDMTMVDYRGHERAFIYKQVGIIGEAANALTTFKHNYFTQMWALRQHSKGRQIGAQKSQGAGLGPEAAFYTLLLTFGGVLGLPGREDFDFLIRLANKVSPARIPTTRELILQLPDLASFGALSTLSGLDLSSKFSAANIIPDDFATAAFPFIGTIGDMIGGAFKAALSPSMTNMVKAADAFTPLSAKLAPETYFTEEGMLQDKDTLEGKYKRDTGDKVARGFGVRSLDESRTMHQDRTDKEIDQFNEDKRASIMESARIALREGRVEDLKGLAQRYVKDYRGKPENFVNQLVENRKGQRMTTKQRRELRNVP